MPTSGALTLDLHYYNTGNDQDEYDTTGVEMCITRTPRASTATTYPFVASATASPGHSVNEYTCTVSAHEPIQLLTSSPPMHGRGTRAKLEIIRQGGTVEVVYDAPFSADNQIATPLDDVFVYDGDQVRTTCEYVNNTGSTITFGNSSDDEMCFNFARFHPMCAMTCTGNSFSLNSISNGLGGGCPTN